MSYSQMSDESELLRQIALGSESAFRVLYLKYYEQLGAYIYQLSDSMEAADEIIQDAFLKIWTNRKALSEVKSFKAYLFVVSKNHALNALKKTLRERKYQQHYNVYYQEVIASEMFDLDSITHYKLLDEAIDQLPSRQKEVFLMSRHERMKYSQIATSLDLSAETVKKYLKLAKMSITEHLLKYAEEEVTY